LEIVIFVWCFVSRGHNLGFQFASELMTESWGEQSRTRGHNLALRTFYSMLPRRCLAKW